MNKRKVFFYVVFIIIYTTQILIPIKSNAKDISVSKSSISIEEGSSVSVTISAKTHTGKIDIKSSNTNVIIANVSSYWAENDSKTITINAKSEGTAMITISGELYDSDTETEKMYSKTIKVTVNKKVVKKEVTTTSKSSVLQTTSKANTATNKKTTNDTQTKENNIKPIVNNSNESVKQENLEEVKNEEKHNIDDENKPELVENIASNENIMEEIEKNEEIQNVDFNDQNYKFIMVIIILSLIIIFLIIKNMYLHTIIKKQ